MAKEQRDFLEVYRNISNILLAYFLATQRIHARAQFFSRVGWAADEGTQAAGGGFGTLQGTEGTPDIDHETIIGQVIHFKRE